MDGCLYASQNFAFIKLPDELTTGSSIMPHKKNPDVFELIRAKCNKIQALPQQISMITGNLPTGYFRDMQIIKEMFLPAFDELISCIDLATFAISNITVSDNILNDDKYSFLFSVEEVNKLVLQGIPFRDAYKLVGTQIANGTFKPEKSVNHTHEGSIGNLCTAEIKARMVTLNKQFDFEKVNQAIKVLVEH
jgi:argininosuccinate lyase